MVARGTQPGKSVHGVSPAASWVQHSLPDQETESGLISFLCAAILSSSEMIILWKKQSGLNTRNVCTLSVVNDCYIFKETIWNHFNSSVYCQRPEAYVINPYYLDKMSFKNCIASFVLAHSVPIQHCHSSFSPFISLSIDPHSQQIFIKNCACCIPRQIQERDSRESSPSRPGICLSKR